MFVTSFIMLKDSRDDMEVLLFLWWISACTCHIVVMLRAIGFNYGGLSQQEDNNRSLSECGWVPPARAVLPQGRTVMTPGTWTAPQARRWHPGHWSGDGTLARGQHRNWLLIVSISLSVVIGHQSAQCWYLTIPFNRFGPWVCTFVR